MLKRAKQYIAIFRPKKRRVRVAKAVVIIVEAVNLEGAKEAAYMKAENYLFLEEGLLRRWFFVPEVRKVGEGQVYEI